MGSGRLIIGIGNEFRGDDAAGLQVVRRLKATCGGSIDLVELSGEGASLIEAWRGADRVVLVDAVSSGSPAGTIHRLDLGAGPLPNPWRCYSTHAFGVAEAVEMARALGQLPASLVFFGIEGGNFAPGRGLSVEVERAIGELAQRILTEIRPVSPAIDC